MFTNKLKATTVCTTCMYISPIFMLQNCLFSFCSFITKFSFDTDFSQLNTYWIIVIICRPWCRQITFGTRISLCEKESIYWSHYKYSSFCFVGSAWVPDDDEESVGDPLSPGVDDHSRRSIPLYYTTPPKLVSILHFIRAICF